MPSHRLAPFWRGVVLGWMAGLVLLGACTPPGPPPVAPDVPFREFDLGGGVYCFERTYGTITAPSCVYAPVRTPVAR